MNILKNKLSLSVKIPLGKEPSTQSALNEESKDFIKKSECNHIYDNIFLSGYTNANDFDFLLKNNFTHIINCAKSSKSFTCKNFENFEYLSFNIDDDPGFPIYESLKIFIEYVEKINFLNPNRKILVHCFEGISRAPSLLAGYMMWKLNISKEAALKMIKDLRPCVEINFGFLYQLENWSKYCEEKNKLLSKKTAFRIQKYVKAKSWKISQYNILPGKIRIIEKSGEEEKIIRDSLES